MLIRIGVSRVSPQSPAQEGRITAWVNNPLLRLDLGRKAPRLPCSPDEAIARQRRAIAQSGDSGPPTRHAVTKPHPDCQSNPRYRRSRRARGEHLGREAQVRNKVAKLALLVGAILDPQQP